MPSVTCGEVVGDGDRWLALGLVTLASAVCVEGWGRETLISMNVRADRIKKVTTGALYCQSRDGVGAVFKQTGEGR